MRRTSWGTRRVAIVTAAFVIAAGSAGVLLLCSYLSQGRALESTLHSASVDLDAGRWSEAHTELVQLLADAAALERRLRGSLPSLAAHVPYLGRSVRTTRVVLDAGTSAAHVALEVLPRIEGHSFFRNGRIDLAALSSFASVARTEHAAVRDALTRVRASSSSLLPGPVGHARALLLDKLTSADKATSLGPSAIDLATSVLGANGTRRYFIAFANPDEMRGASGLWGNYGVLVVRDGKLSLGRFGRLQDELGRYATNPGPPWYREQYEHLANGTDWRQLPSAPDLPTVAQIAESNLRSAAGIGPVDGTIVIDPVGLAAFLRITGPVTVASWPQPLTASNVVPATLHDAYDDFSANDQRVSFLGDAARAVWGSIVHTNLSTTKLVSSGIGDAVTGKHLLMHFTRPREERLARIVGADGSLGDPRRTFGLVTQNLGADKMDYWLHRSIDLSLDLQRDGGASGTIGIELKNAGPSSGEPRYVVGPNVAGLRPGWNYQDVRLYLPAGTTVDPGSDGALSSELGSVEVDWNVAIPPGGHVRRSVSFSVERLWGPDVHILLRRQGTVSPDDVLVTVQPPWGRRLVGRADNCGPLTSGNGDVMVSAAARRTLFGWVLGPWARQITCGDRAVTIR